MSQIDLKRFLRRLVIFEGLRLKAYQDSVGIWTIGIGTIRYPNGNPVKRGDVVTEDQAYEYATKEAQHMLAQLEDLLVVPQSESQLIALLCLMYNIGTTGLKNSSVLKSINQKAPEEEITANWMKWNKGRVNGKLEEIKGLTNRRKVELDIYFGRIKG